LEFYSEVASRGDLSNLSRTFRLSHERRTVAMLFGLIDRNCFRYIILACDYARYAEFSPGLLIFERVITYWAQAGGEVFDFTIGDEPYKGELGCTSTPMFALAVS
jgi:CelD/BcsL family acetyltransferase involved in cellulose biosynthesis